LRRVEQREHRDGRGPGENELHRSQVGGGGHAPGLRLITSYQLGSGYRPDMKSRAVTWPGVCRARPQLLSSAK
jgi:hypothetical protein